MIFLTAVQVAISIALFTIAWATLHWMLHAWRTPERFENTGYPATVAPPVHSFSLIVAMREEPEDVIIATVNRLVAQRHPDFEIILAVGHDDMLPVGPRGMNTQEIAHLIAAEINAKTPGKVKVATNYDAIKNKPRQLNTALALCTKEIVGILDAESLTHPDLLASIDSMFTHHGADVVQGSVHLTNYRATWFSLRNCLEYRTWFRSRLIGHASSGFLPLGGTTVFTRRLLIEEIGGWDGDCLAEDC
ncbi:MAG: glycosyltransferase family 2 protein, partial [Cryobacterium sp.]|nr:glycosyltransferase family 2 protein [Cryobacterium sp.]